MDNFLKHFPTMRAFIDLVKARVRLNGFVTMMSARKRMLPGEKKRIFPSRAPASRCIKLAVCAQKLSIFSKLLVQNLHVCFL